MRYPDAPYATAYSQIHLPEHATIRGYAHSDDYRIVGYFDALSAFERLERIELYDWVLELALAEGAYGWGGDYPGDRVLWALATQPGICADIDSYCALTGDGFECYVNPRDLLAWLYAERIAVYDDLVTTWRQEQGEQA